MESIHDDLAQPPRREATTLKMHLRDVAPRSDLEVCMDADGEYGYTDGKDGFRVDAVIHEPMLTVAVEAKQFVATGDELVKGSLYDGIGQAVQYAAHFDRAELWHFYVVPFDLHSVEQNAALTQMANCHERVRDWFAQSDDFPVSLRSIAIRHARHEVDVVASLGDSVVESASSVPDDLRPDDVPAVLKTSHELADSSPNLDTQ